MKTDARGETEGHPDEYAPAGPVKIATLAERKALAAANELISSLCDRIAELEAQAAALQMSAPKGVPDLQEKAHGHGRR
jgi:hypothetical protein